MYPHFPRARARLTRAHERATLYLRWLTQSLITAGLDVSRRSMSFRRLALAAALVSCEQASVELTSPSGATSSGSSSSTGPLSSPDAGSSSPDSSETSADSTSTGASTCGNGTIDPGEHCDGAALFGAACPSACKFPERFELWSVIFDVSGASDRALDLDVSDGLIGVAGEAETGGAEASDILVAQLREDGTVMFATSFAAARGTVDYAEAALLHEGRLLVAGRVGKDVWVAAFEDDGSLRWRFPFSGEDSENSYSANSIVYRYDGSILVTANSDIPEIRPGYLISFDAEGQDLAVQQIVGPLNQVNEGALWGLRAAETPRGDLVFAAATDSMGMINGWTEARDAAGETLWASSFDGPAPGSNDRVADIAVDLEGNVVITADWPTDEPSGLDIMARMYAPDGEVTWTYIYDGPAGANDEAGGVAVDVEGNVYLHGRSEMGSEDHDMVAVKLGASGELLWKDTWSSAWSDESSRDFGTDVEISDRGLVVLLGYTRSQATDYDVLVRTVAP